MPNAPTQPSLLEELDKRQDQVLDELDRLNVQVENLLNECLRTRKAELDAAVI